MPTGCMYHVLEHFSIHILNSVDKTLKLYKYSVILHFDYLFSLVSSQDVKLF